MANNTGVCRTCLTLIPNREPCHNIDEENTNLTNVKNIREMIMLCVPEMDLYVTDSSSVCEPCLKHLIMLHNFKNRCLRVEKAIQNYVVKTNKTENVDLYDVIRNQMQDALLHKKWTTERIENYLEKVNGSILNKKNVFPAMQNIETALPLNHASAISPNVLPTGDTENPSLDRVLDKPIEQPRISVVPPERLIEPPATSKTTLTKYITVRKNLMPETSALPPILQPPTPNSAMNLLYRRVNKPSIIRFNRPRQVQEIRYFRGAFLNKINYANINEHIAKGSHIYAPRTYSRKVPKTSKDLQAVIPCLSPVLLNAEINNEYLNNDPMISSALVGVSPKHNEEVVLMPNTVNETIQSSSQKQSTSQEPQEEILESSGGILPSTTKLSENPEAPPTDVIINIPSRGNEVLKRKLTPDQVKEEILSKRRKLVIKLERNVPQLLCRKKLIVKIEKTLHECTFCSFASNKPEELKAHHMYLHKVCMLCNFTCNDKTDIDRHIDNMHPTELRNALDAYNRRTFEFRCNLCSYEATSLPNLKKHRFAVHFTPNDLTGLYHCPFNGCESVFVQCVDMITHIEGIHDMAIRRQCPLCNHKAKRPYYVRYHLAGHFTTNLATCKLCLKSFKTQLHLRTHMRRTHKNDQQGEILGKEVNRPEGNFDMITDKDERVALSTTLHQSDLNSPSEEQNVEEEPDLMEFLCQQSIDICSDNEDKEKCEPFKESDVEKERKDTNTEDLEELLDEHILNTKILSEQEMLKSKTPDPLDSETDNIAMVDKAAIPLEELLDQHFSETSALENAPIDPLLDKNEVDKSNIVEDLETLLDDHNYSANPALIVVESSDDEDIDLIVPTSAVIPMSNKATESGDTAKDIETTKNSLNELNKPSDDTKTNVPDSVHNEGLTDQKVDVENDKSCEKASSSNQSTDCGSHLEVTVASSPMEENNKQSEISTADTINVPPEILTKESTSTGSTQTGALLTSSMENSDLISVDKNETIISDKGVETFFFSVSPNSILTTGGK
ncbi:uncharacterized protein LOC126740091 isoform X3 [Anthonomus grandis grandis]|uniref:uncharacterized protein LOC126740091 isoform X3 n=1 Tax=Anthonomus grandis grandis TaxID=2921223 RepID=UPI002165441A|nr:uncharacterized protein LOC126740091 isoform X3 [Anthonomus grandis grandis]